MDNNKITIFSVNIENNDYLNDTKQQICIDSWKKLKVNIENQGYKCEIKIFQPDDIEVIKYKEECNFYISHTKSLSRVSDGFRMYILSRYKNYLWLDTDVYCNDNIIFTNKTVFTNDWWYIYNGEELKIFDCLYNSFYKNAENIYNLHPEWISDWMDSDIFKMYVHVSTNLQILENLKNDLSIIHFAPLFNRLNLKFNLIWNQYDNINEIQIKRTSQMEKHSVIDQIFKFPRNESLENILLKEKVNINLFKHSYTLFNNIINENNTKYLIDSLEVEITDKCNLNCVGCNHLSCLTKNETVYNINKFENDLQQINKLFLLRRLLIIGGEPTLNPNLTDYIKLAFLYLPNTQIELWTNGTKKDKLIELEELFPSLKIRCAGYGVVEDYKSGKLGKNHTTENSLKPWWKLNFNLKGNSDPFLARSSCMEQKCFLLHEGNIYICPILKNINKLENTFNVKFNLKEDERCINIYTNTSKNIILFLHNCNHSGCRYCNEKRVYRNWQLSKITEEPLMEDYFDMSTVEVI